MPPRATMMVNLRDRSLRLLLGMVACLSMTTNGLQAALNPGEPTAGIYLDTTVTISSAAFARLARSEAFYRETRNAKVVELSQWTASADPNDVATKSTTPLAFLKSLPSPNKQEQGHQELQREAHLLCLISTPLGSFDVTVVQQHAFGIAQNRTVLYSEADCITGFPMFRGDVSVKTTYVVTAAEGDPGSIRVRVGVTVGEIPLRRAPRWLKARVQKIVRADGVNHAKGWLQKMTAAEEGGEM